MKNTFPYESALQYLAEKSKKLALELLVEAGFDASEKENNNSTLLHFATRATPVNEKTLETMRYILDQNLADVSAKDVHGKTALISLLHPGRDWREKEADRNAAIRLLLSHNIDVSPTLYREFDVPGWFSNTSTGNPLDGFYLCEDLDIMKEIIARGENVHAFDVETKTPLMSLAELQSETGDKYLDHIDVLIEAGANINQRQPKSGLTPFHFLFLPDCSGVFISRKVIDRFVYHGADVNATDSRKNNALHHFLKAHDSGCHLTKTIEDLLEVGVSVNQINSDGLSPYWLTYQIQCRPQEERYRTDEQLEEAREILVEHGAWTMPRSIAEYELASKFRRQSVREYQDSLKRVS